jgi:hypothetical protein
MLVLFTFRVGSGGDEAVRVVSESGRSAKDRDENAYLHNRSVLFDVRQESVARMRLSRSGSV